MSRLLLRTTLRLPREARPLQFSPAIRHQSTASTPTTPITSTPARHPNNAANPTSDLPRPIAYKKSHPSAPPAVMDNSVATLLPYLAAQPGHYITIHIHGFPYLVREGDQVRLPFRMPGVQPGDVLRLNRASVIGSRDYTLKGDPHVDEALFECRATVVGADAEPMRIVVKTKRRQRRTRTVKSKQKHTLLRISQLSIRGEAAEDA